MKSEQMEMSTYKMYDLTLKVLEEKTIFESATSSERISEFIYNAIQPQHFSEERVYIISLNAKGDVIGYAEHSKGALSSSMVDVANIFKFALLSNASAIILTHNHPSGHAEPSAEDMAATRRVKDAGELLGVQLLDHIITSPLKNTCSVRMNSTLWE